MCKFFSAESWFVLKAKEPVVEILCAFLDIRRTSTKAPLHPTPISRPSSLSIVHETSKTRKGSYIQQITCFDVSHNTRNVSSKYPIQHSASFVRLRTVHRNISTTKMARQTLADTASASERHSLQATCMVFLAAAAARRRSTYCEPARHCCVVRQSIG
jgi:hypothetical protein